MTHLCETIERKNGIMILSHIAQFHLFLDTDLLRMDCAVLGDGLNCSIFSSL